MYILYKLCIDFILLSLIDINGGTASQTMFTSEYCARVDNMHQEGPGYYSPVNTVLGRAIFTKGIYHSPVNTVHGGQHSQ